MSWPTNTRRKVIALSSLTKGTTNPLTWDVPRTGLLAGLYLVITGAVAGTLSAPNAFGMASIIRRVRLIANSGINIIDISGPGYHYLIRDNLEHFVDVAAGATARNAVTATTFDVSMFIPIALNGRDPLGLIMLQNPETALQLQVEFEADATVATGATVTATVQPFLELFTVPFDPKDYPPLTYLHTIREETVTVSGAGDVTYYWPRGNTYVALYHGAGIAQSGADSWSRAKVRVNQSDFIYDLTPAALDREYQRFHGRTRNLGAIPVDLIGSSGLGNYGSARDLFDSNAVTDVATVVTATGALTFYVVRRELVNLFVPSAAK